MEAKATAKYVRVSQEKQDKSVTLLEEKMLMKH